MGWTEYYGMTAKQAADHELRGMDILATSGSWRIARTTTGVVLLVQALTRRTANGTAIKVIDASMGPADLPPKGIFRRWLKESEGQARGQHEQDFITRANADHERVKPNLKVGDTFTLTRVIKFTDGVETDTFTYLGKYTARRPDGSRVRLPKNFRKMVVASELTI